MTRRRTTLLLLPGMLNDARLWAAIRPMLAGIADFHVADVGRHDTISGMAEAALAAVDTPDLCVAGFSMGGYVAQEMLAIAPQAQAMRRWLTAPPGSERAE